MKPTLVILAAGIASRYGSMKQTQPFGPSGETIMEYSIFDAIKAGFGKVVFIIREDFAENFKIEFESKLNGRIATDYVFQKIESFTNGRTIPTDRAKPWGTAHSLLCGKGKINEPFAMINADDFYGNEGFVKAFNFLTKDVKDDCYAIIGYELKETLSDNGSVNRGVCNVDANGNLIDINERAKIYRNDKGIITYVDKNGLNEVSENASVSMNFFGFAPSIIHLCETMFTDFLDKNINNSREEFFITLVVDEFVKSKGDVKVIPTSAKWFGVTYKQDAPVVRANIEKLVTDGAYPVNLWS